MEPAGPDMLIWPMRAPGLAQEALLDHLVVGEEGAVEEDDGGALQALGERLVDGGAAGDIEEGLLGRRIADLEADGVAFLRPEIVAGGGILQIERDLAGDGEGLDRQPEIAAGALQAPSGLSSGSVMRGTRGAASTWKTALDLMMSSTRSVP